MNWNTTNNAASSELYSFIKRLRKLNDTKSVYGQERTVKDAKGRSRTLNDTKSVYGQEYTRIVSFLNLT